MGRTRTLLRGTAVTGGLLLLGGCVDRTVNGNTISYGFAWWVGAVILLAGLLAIPLGWVLRRFSKRLMVVGFILGPVLLALVLPAMFLDGVTIDDRHFEGRYGIWFSPTKFDVAYADLKHITLVTYDTRSRRGGRRTKQRLECVDKRGETTKIELGDLLRRAKDDMLERAAAGGVSIFERDDRTSAQ